MDDDLTRLVGLLPNPKRQMSLPEFMNELKAGRIKLPKEGLEAVTDPFAAIVDYEITK